MAAIGRGDEAALAEVYRRCVAVVRGTALRVLGERGLADDVTQAVFLALWQAPQRYDPSRGSLRALLVAMAHHRSVDIVRADRARRRRERHHDGGSAGLPGSPVMDAVIDGLSAEAVRRALHTLGAEQRAAIELAYFEGRTYREVARQLAVPEGTIKSRIRRGLDRLRASLENGCQPT